MPDWQLPKEKLKKYPHFDRILSVQEAENLANNAERVSKHTFFPFLYYYKRWTRYAKKGKKGEVKKRKIRYAARSDAYIYMKYRAVLSDLYEKYLESENLSNVVLAYRRTIDAYSGSGSTNIHFARDAFQFIKNSRNCCAISLDISSFFESIDHKILRSCWADLLGVDRLPVDHFQVFRAITRYSEVDVRKCLTRLGYIGFLPGTSGKTGKPLKGFLRPRHAMPKQLCSAKDFQLKIAGGNGSPSIIQTNGKPFGIPQGSPISDLLANIYLTEFDKSVQKLARSLSGRYTRYSDDILFIAPMDAAEAIEVEGTIRELIRKFGSELKIKKSKSTIVQFFEKASYLSFRVVYDGQSLTEKRNDCIESLLSRGIPLESTQGQSELAETEESARRNLNGLEYVGFRFDGQRIYLRDSTLANLNRKITFKAKSSARSFLKSRGRLSKTALIGKFEEEKNRCFSSVDRVRDFEKFVDDTHKWTFRTYFRKAVNILDGHQFRGNHQLRNLRSKFNRSADRSLLAYMKKLEKA
jgi:hypothetical protein